MQKKRKENEQMLPTQSGNLSMLIQIFNIIVLNNKEEYLIDLHKLS